MVSVNLIANTDLRTAEEFRQLVVKEQDGVVVRLGDIADVVLGAENYDEDVRFNGETAVFMGVWVLPTANIAGRHRGRPRGDARHPGRAARRHEGGHPVRLDRIHPGRDHREVLTTLTETLLIVIAVIFLFLGSVRAVIIPVVAIPISLVGAVFLMLVAGFTVNLLTLLAIVLSVGLVVDDAIVMVENIERHLHAGKRPFRAAIEAARELVGPIIAMTITLAAVYAPIGIQGGLTGALFREFAFTLAGAVIVSGVVALTLSPMMGSQAAARRRHRARLRRLDQSPLRQPAQRLHARRSARSLAYRPVVLTLWAIVALLIVPFYMFSQRELAPPEDQGVVFSIIQAAPNATIEQTKLFAQQINNVYKSFPESRRHLRAHVSERRVRRHGDQAVERADQDGAAAADGSDGAAVADSGRARVSHDAAGAAGRRRLSGGPGDRVAC